MVQSDSPLSGRWLVIARSVWAGITVFTLVIWIVGIPVRYAQLRTVCVVTSCGDQQPRPESIAAGLSLGFYSAYTGTMEVLYVLVYVVIALVLFYYKSNNRMALFSSLFLITYGVTSASAPNALMQTYPAWAPAVNVAQGIGLICLGIFLFIFPDGRFVPRWTRITAVVWVILLILSNTPFFPPLGFILLILCYVIISMIAQIYRYRRVSSPAQRQQTRWVVFGTITAIVGFLALISIGIFVPHSQSPGSIGFYVGNTAVYLSLLIIPLSIGFAILHSRLWDIDILINRTLVYGTLTATLALVYFAFIFVLQYLLRGIISQTNNGIAIVVSTLAIAALFQPLRRRIQKVIDRRFYRSKYDATKTLAAFSATLRNEVDLSQLQEQLVAVVEETMQPTHVSLWLKQTEQNQQ